MDKIRDTNPLSGLYQDFTAILKDLVIKYTNEAEKYETLESKKAGDKYVAAYYSADTYLSYNFTEDDFNEIGIHNIDEINRYINNRRTIPYKYRDTLLKLKRGKLVGAYKTVNGLETWIPGSYVEKNEYYRKLAGLPPLDSTEKDFIYVPEETGKKYGVSSTIPIHKLSDEKISILEEVGFIDSLKKDHTGSKYEYLNYMGSRSIPISVARRAQNFSLLRMSGNVNSDVMISEFKLIYEQCRQYFVETIYSYYHSQVIVGYDNFIGLSIMVMAMQQIFMRQINTVVTRDFFDTELIKWLFEAYAVPYISNLTFTIKKNIAQNLNHLIQYKGTNHVLFDIGTLLGIDHLYFYKHYLIKNQKYDPNTKEPINKTKEVTDDFGNKHIVPDFESMYDVYFQKVELDNLDYLNALKEHSNQVNYHDVVDNDPLWWEDEDLFKELYEDHYNYKETKYLSMAIAYRMTDIMFDTTYLLRLLIDKKEGVSQIPVLLPRILGTQPTNLFTCVIALCAMTAKMHGLAGDILVDPSKILHVLGFNFQQDFDKIREDIAANPYLDSNSILKYLKNMNAYTAKSVNDLYNNIADLAEFLTNAMADADDKDVYHAYYDLYRALYIEKENKELFIIPGTEDDPIYAKTYLEYLEYISPDLYKFINELPVEEVPQYAEHIISRIIQIIPRVESLYSLTSSNSTVVDALIQLVRFFKSHTVELLGLSIVYILDVKALNMLRFIDDLWYMYKLIGMIDNWNLDHSDVISKLTSVITRGSNLPLRDRIKMKKLIQAIEDTNSMLYDNLKLIASIKPEENTFGFYDVVGELMGRVSVDGGLVKFMDSCKWTSVYTLPSNLKMHDSSSQSNKMIGANGNIDLEDVASASGKIEVSDEKNNRSFMRDSISLKWVD